MTKKKIFVVLLAVVMIVSCCCIFSACGDKSCAHIYDNACDSICNECGATRIVAHSYDDSQDPTCNTCGEERVVIHAHVYDNNCDETCNTCGETRMIEHAYTNTCDKTCNVCGVKRVVTHTYDNACDTMCNICGEMQIAEHTYDNDQDETCNVCGFVRDVIHEHVYDNACDGSCNTCGNERTPADHVYTSDEDVDCDVCGFVRELACTHEYDNNCDTTCNKCNNTRVVDNHVYDNDCDANCNICDANRTISHTYDNECDTTCNVCKEIRIVNEHVYDNACDAFCNECGANREVVHVDANNDEQCDNCNIIISSDTEEVKITAFINYFNNYLNSVHNTKREDLLSSNTKFSNIISSGSINVNLNEIVSIAVYDNFKHYIYNDGSELFIVQTENGEYSVSYYDGKYERDKIKRFNEHHHENLFPLLTRTDVFINENGTFSISSDYLKKVYRAWFNSDIEDTWIFGTYQISYHKLNVWMDYADFVTEITCDENGMITSYNIVLKNDNKEYYNSTFVTSTQKTEIHFVMNTDVLTTVDFVYNKSTNGNAEFNLEIVDSDGTHTLTLKTDVTTNIPDFTSNSELDAALAETKNMFDNVLAMANKYGYEYTMNDTCALVACYDEVYNMYAIFEYYNGKYYYLGCSVSLDDIAACTATVNENHVLTVIQHHSYETIKTFLTEKYADQYVLINNSNNIPAVFIYDNETNVYVLFVNIGNAFIYGAFAEEIPPEYAMFPIGTIDLVNKTITV